MWHLAPSFGWSPSAVSTWVLKNYPQMRTVGTAYLGWPWRQPKDGISATPEPSVPPLPLSYHGQTEGCSLFYFTYRNYHLLPIFLKLIFGSEQTPRGGKAPDKRSVSL